MRANARATASSEAGRSTENERTPGASSASAALNSRSTRRPLLNWWLTSTPSQRTLPAEAERSLAIATASKPFSAAVSSAAHATIAVIGTCPLIAPAAFNAARPGSSVRRASRRGGPATATVRAIGGASPMENSASSQPERRTISSATAESLPPPIGTSTRRGGVCAAGRRAHEPRRRAGRRSAVAAKRGPRAAREARWCTRARRGPRSTAPPAAPRRRAAAGPSRSDACGSAVLK